LSNWKLSHVKIHWWHQRESHRSLKSHISKVHLLSLLLKACISSLLILLEAPSRILLIVLLLLRIVTLIRSSSSPRLWRCNLLCNFRADHLQQRHENAFKLTLIHLLNVFKVWYHHRIRRHGKTPAHTHQGHQWILHWVCCLTISSQPRSSHIWNSGALLRCWLVSVVVPSIVVLLLV
jgi:hypothetical protein